ncbi:MAG: ABC transporter substrate-binding protein [Caldilineaceae bacterium]|nr:ABC transporter substrate-binding protein [Caldilineaceae bacterium]
MKLCRDVQFLSVILVFLLFVGGCAAPAAAPAAPPSDSAPITTDVQATEATQPAVVSIFPTLIDPRDQELRIAVATDASSLDPARASGSTSSMILHALYQTLVTASSDSLGTFEPNLADKWEYAEDAQSITFHLRQESIFSNGDQVTAEDVKFSIERLKSIQGAPAYLANTIESVKVVDDFTVQLQLTEPDLAIVAKLADTAFSVLDDDTVLANNDEAETWLNANSAGSGPYVLESWDHDDIWLVSNPFYQNYQDRIERILVQIVPQQESRLVQLLSGEIDIALDLGVEDFLTSKSQTNPDFNVVSEPTQNLVYLAMNQDPAIGGLVSDPQVQKAIRLALDYEGIRELVGATTTPPSFLPRGLPGAIDNEFFQDVNQAREILEGGGYNCPSDPSSCEGIPLIYPEGSLFYSQFAEKVSADLKEIGLSIDLVPTDPRISFQGNHPLRLSSIGTDYLDASAYLGFLPGGSIAERINWRDDDMEALRNEILTSTDPVERNDMFMNAQVIVNDRGPYAFLVQTPVFTGLNSSVQKYSYNSQYTVSLVRLRRKCDCDQAASICSNITVCSSGYCKRCARQCSNVSSC